MSQITNDVTHVMVYRTNIMLIAPTCELSLPPTAVIVVMYGAHKRANIRKSIVESFANRSGRIELSRVAFAPTRIDSASIMVLPVAKFDTSVAMVC